MQVSELAAVSNPCPKDLTPYLEADFLCIKGVDIIHIIHRYTFHITGYFDGYAY